MPFHLYYTAICEEGKGRRFFANSPTNSVSESKVNVRISYPHILCDEGLSCSFLFLFKIIEYGVS